MDRRGRIAVGVEEGVALWNRALGWNARGECPPHSGCFPASASRLDRQAEEQSERDGADHVKSLGQYR